MNIHRIAPIILLLEGLASSGLQMIVIRQTVPFIGSSIITTSIIISCFLAALALGYYHGGLKAEKNFIKTLTTNLTISICLFGFGLSYTFINWFFSSAHQVTNGIPFLSSPLIHLSIFCLTIMAPLAYLLSQTVPLLIQASKSEKSQAAGNATALSTIGNVAGCLITSLVIMFYFGVGASVLFNCTILAICIFLLVDTSTLTRSLSYTTALFLPLCVIFILNIAIPGKLFSATTPYSNIFVAKEFNGNRLVVNRSSSSFIDEENKGWPYIEIMKKGIFINDMSDKDILILGAGGFTLTAESDFGAKSVTYVDVDQELKVIAENEFLNESIKGRFVVQDARYFLLTNESKYDIIVSDLYTNAATIPAHTASFEFFSLISQRLKPTGKAVLNIAANPTFDDDYSSTMDATIRAALSRCITDLDGYSNKISSIVYFCKPKTEANSVASIYKDDTTKLEIDSYVAATTVPHWSKKIEQSK